MAPRTHTYAIRLAVEGGGHVKAELVLVGQSGEQSLKRIETAGDKASGGLKGLGRQAELLRTGIRTLRGPLIGAATVGGLAALVDRSISALDAIGKTADKIGVGVEALGLLHQPGLQRHIALILCCGACWTGHMVRRWHADPFGFLRPWNEVPALMASAPPATPPSTGTGVVTFLMG